MKKALKRKCGTPGYLAPEMIENKSYDFKVDVFSLGVILFTMLNGSPPFRGKNIKEIIKKN
jgi:serine/threonine protein kinase